MNLISKMNVFVLLGIVSMFSAQSLLGIEWQTLQPGLSYTEAFLLGQDSETEYPFHILKIDPENYSFHIVSCKTNSEPLKPIEEWCESEDFIAAVNAGMFQPDYNTNVGYMRMGEVINNPAMNHYQSVFVTNPKNTDLPNAQIIDLDDQSFASVKAQYKTIVQNLRLIKKRGENRWSPQANKWTEVALAEDNEGNILFILTRQPYTMYKFNEILLRSQLGIVAMQHLEGGPEASFLIRTEAFHLLEVGSYESDFNENDNNLKAWSIPNVLGIRKR